jgi:hypothetical protein
VGLLDRRRPRCEYNIKMTHKQSVNWSNLTGLRWRCLVPKIINLRVPQEPRDVMFVTLNVCVMTFG